LGSEYFLVSVEFAKDNSARYSGMQICRVKKLLYGTFAVNVHCFFSVIKLCFGPFSCPALEVLYKVSVYSEGHKVTH